MNSKKTLLWWSFSVLIAFLIGIGLAQYKNKHGGEEIVRKNFNYKYINPLLECNSDISLNNKLNPLRKKIQNIIDVELENKNITYASVYYRDLNSGPWFGINEKVFFSPASLVKVPVLITYLKIAENDPSILQKKLIVSNDPDTGNDIQNIKPSQATITGSEYTVEQLLEKMIIYSDNNAYDVLVDNLDSDDILKVYRDLDVDISKAFQNPNGNIITVKNYASFFRILYNASYLDQETSEKALKLLTQVEYKNALTAGVPNDVSVAHKFGERKYLDTNEIQFHDCGIVYYSKKPYLLCIMTKTNKAPEKAINLIKSISKTVYEDITKQM